MNIKQIILSAKKGTVAPTVVEPDFAGQLYINTATGQLFYANSTTTGDYKEIVSFSDLIASNIDTNSSGLTVQDFLDNLQTDTHTHTNKVELDLITDGDHDIRIDNPHGVDKTDVGLSNVSNDLQLKDADKDIDPTLSANSDILVPSQKAVKSFIDAHKNDLNNPHNVTADQVDTNSSGQTVQDIIDAIEGAVNQITIFFQPDQSHNIDNYRVNQLSTSGNANYTFLVPDNFVSLVSLEVLFIPTNNIIAKTIDLTSSYALPGEVITQNQETSIGQSLNGTQDTIELEDISTVFSNLLPGFVCGFNWKNNVIGTAISILAIKMTYSAI